MVTDKKRVTISLSDERYSEFEKLVKKSGMTKSTLCNKLDYERN